MKEQKIVKIDTEYSANNAIEKLRKDGWMVTQIAAAKSEYMTALYMLFERETEENIPIYD